MRPHGVRSIGCCECDSAYRQCKRKQPAIKVTTMTRAGSCAFNIGSWSSPLSPHVCRERGRRHIMPAGSRTRLRRHIVPTHTEIRHTPFNATSYQTSDWQKGTKPQNVPAPTSICNTLAKQCKPSVGARKHNLRQSEISAKGTARALCVQGRRPA